MHAIHTLGKFFTWHVHIAGDQQLIQDGLYRWLRHPSYFGAFLLFGAIPLTLNAYFAAAASLVMQFLAYRYRVGIEEEAMIATFGGHLPSLPGEDLCVLTGYLLNKGARPDAPEVLYQPAYREA